MENRENHSIQLELKYCERCGGLWLRPKSSDLIFCAACSKAMAGLMPIQIQTARVAGHPARDERDDPKPFWSEGGNA